MPGSCVDVNFDFIKFKESVPQRVHTFMHALFGREMHQRQARRILRHRRELRSFPRSQRKFGDIVWQRLVRLNIDPKHPPTRLRCDNRQGRALAMRQTADNAIRPRWRTNRCAQQRCRRHAQRRQGGPRTGSTGVKLPLPTRYRGSNQRRLLWILRGCGRRIEPSGDHAVKAKRGAD